MEQHNYSFVILCSKSEVMLIWQHGMAWLPTPYAIQFSTQRSSYKIFYIHVETEQKICGLIRFPDLRIHNIFYKLQHTHGLNLLHQFSKYLNKKGANNQALSLHLALGLTLRHGLLDLFLLKPIFFIKYFFSTLHYEQIRINFLNVRY